MATGDVSKINDVLKANIAKVDGVAAANISEVSTVPWGSGAVNYITVYYSATNDPATNGVGAFTYNSTYTTLANCYTNDSPIYTSVALSTYSPTGWYKDSNSAFGQWFYWDSGKVAWEGFTIAIDASFTIFGTCDAGDYSSKATYTDNAIGSTISDAYLWNRDIFSNADMDVFDSSGKYVDGAAFPGHTYYQWSSTTSSWTAPETCE